MVVPTPRRIEPTAHKPKPRVSGVNTAGCQWNLLSGQPQKFDIQRSPAALALLTENQLSG